MKYLALGDSYTIGEGVRAEDSWPAQLARRLQAAGFHVRPPEIIAISGWTTDELAQGISGSLTSPPYDLVSLLIGVNNQYRGYPQAGYALEFSQLLERSIRLAGGNTGRVMVISIPDWSVTPFAEGRDRKKIRTEIDAFNAINRTEAARRGAVYVDITRNSRQAAADPGLTAADGLHPSAQMYAAWAELILPAAVEMLSRT